MSRKSEEPSREHPDELTLTGWSEGRLLEFELADVEAHLARCGDCRDLVAELGLESAPPSTSSADDTLAPRRANGRLLSWGTWIAAAAALVLLFVVSKQGDPGNGETEEPWRFELSLAGSREATFGTVRDTELATEEFFVGVRLVESGWIRLVAVDERGQIYEVPLDPLGTTSDAFLGDSENVFGPYPTSFGEGQSVVAIVALLSEEHIEWSAVESSGWTGELGSESIDALGASLDVEARVQSLR